MGKRIYKFFRVWGNLLLFAITIYPFIITYLIPSQADGDLKSLFGWHWQTWLIIFLFSIIITLVIQNLNAKYENHEDTKLNVNSNNGGNAFGFRDNLGNIAIYQEPTHNKKDDGEIDISIESIAREKGEYVSLKVKNNNPEKPIYCKALIVKKEWYRVDPIHPNGGEWIQIKTDENGPLSWHHGRTDDEGYRKIDSEPGYINIARAWAKRDMNFALRGHMMFTYLVEKPAKAGRYKLWIDVHCRMGDRYRKETWMGCIDMVNPFRSDMLTMMGCEDVID